MILETNITIVYNRDWAKPVYNVKPRFEKSIFVSVDREITSTEVIRDFEVLEKESELKMCSKTPSCKYTSSHGPNLRRHEATCTSEQQVITQQKDYGSDKATIKRLMELGYLPEEAAQYRKTFFTCFDIESLENLENVEDMKNVGI